VPVNDKSKILVVEDEMGPRESLKVILEPYYNVHTAETGGRALEILHNIPIDLVTVDLKMPRFSGIKVLERVKQHDQHIEAIIITGYSSMDTVIEALRLGAFDYIAKPFDVNHLLALVRRALARRNGRTGPERATTGPIEILLVEDNPGDVRLTLEAFKEGKARNNVSVVGDGEEALAFLCREGKYADAPRPDLILLDLNLPKKDGREVLAEIKADEDLKRIPVVILTASKAEEDIIKSYDLYANCYIVKPGDMDQFFRIVNSVEDFWSTIVRLPAR